MNTTRFSGCTFPGANGQILALLVFALGTTVAGFSQQITGTIVGTVKDPQGAVVGTATVKAANVDTGFSRSATANGFGEYRIEFLPVGTYTVQVDAAGFKTYVQRGIVLTVDQTQTVDVTLAIGAQSQTVTVTGAPVLVDTSSAELGRTVQPAEIIGLPLVNRNAYAELSLTPGVQANSFSQQSDPSGTPNFTIGLPSADVQINGSIDGGNPEVSFYLDGGLNMTGIRNYGQQLPNPDALEEFRVETSDFSAQYGRMSSAVVTAVTKSGTNQFHGSLFEFNRNTDFNAYPWNAPKNAAGQFINAPYHRNNFGGVIGGPIKRDKAFFLFSYGGLRQVVGQYLSGGRVPTDAERDGDFTDDLPLASNPKVSTNGGAPFVIDSPGTKTPLTGYTNNGPGCSSVGVNANNPTNENCIPATLMDATAGTLLSGSNANASIPLPNTANSAGAVVNWTGYFTGPTMDNEYLGKYDEVLSDRDHLAMTYFYIHTTQNGFGGGNFPWTINQSYTGQSNADISEIHTFSPETANQAWISFTRAAGGRVNLPTINIGDLGSSYTIQGPSTLPNISVSGDFTAGVSLAGPVTTSDFYSIRDMVTMTKGKHSLTYGAELALDKGMFAGNLYDYGQFAFSTSAPTTTGNALSDFVTGMVATLEQDSPYHTLTSAWHTALFVQDNYRLTPRFTANLGLRWDIDTPPVESSNRTATFINSDAALTADSTSTGTASTITPSAPAGMFFPGDPGVPRGIVTMKWHHVSPRVGFAWDPFGDGKTAIRAGAGVFYGSVAGNEWNQPGNAQPFAVRQTNININSFSNVYAPTLVNGSPSGFPNGDPFPYTYTPSSPRWLPQANIETLAQNIQWPYIYQFNTSIQRELPQHVTATVAYVGTLSHRVPMMVDDNYAPYAAGANSSTSGKAGSIDARRPYDENSTGTGVLGQNIYLTSNQTASYHSLQISANRPLTHNLMLNGFYVWSHALQSANESADGLATAQDWDNLWEERGPMNDDQRHVAAISGTWNIDYFDGANRVVKEVADGWTISPIYFVQSGAPFFATTGSDKNDDSQNSNRPDLVAGVSPFLSPHRSRAAEAAEWFNTGAFVANGPGVTGGIGPGGADGNEPRNYLRAPGYRDVDLGIFRDFNFERGVVFQLRGEATNAFNLVSLNAPSSSGPPATAGAAPSSSTFGVISGATSPRIIQVGARLTF